MTTYFFHTVVNGIETRDEDGTDLTDENAAWRQASAAFGELITEVDGDMQVGSEWTMNVTTTRGPLFVITLSSSRVG